MSPTPRDNSGALFANDRREMDSHPHLNGSCQVDGVPYWLAGWIVTPRAGGEDFVSGALRRKDAPKDAPKPAKDDPNLRFAIFPNDRKDSAEKPDFTGRCQIEGVQWWINGWNKSPRDAGNDFIALAFEKAVGGATRSTGRLDARAMLASAKSKVPGAAKSEPPAAAGDFDDDVSDIPF